MRNEVGAVSGIDALLAARWSPPEYASFSEMMDTTGGAHSRIDYFAVSCWTSKGGKGHSIGVEVKASRGDFLRELKEPRKRAFAWKVSNECWFAVEKDVVKDVSEIPEGWGLLERTAAGLVIRRAAQQREIDPWPWTFIAAFARRQSDAAPKYTKALYRYAGRELDEDAIIALAKELHGHTIANDIAKARRAAVEEYIAQHRQDDAIVRAVRERFGWNVKAADLPRLFTEGGGVSHHEASAIRYALGLLNSAVERVLPSLTPAAAVHTTPEPEETPL